MEERYIWLDRLLQNRVLAHTLFWLGVLIFPPLFSDFLEDTFWQAFAYRAINLPLKIIATYLLVYYQIPVFFHKKKYFQFFITFLLIAYILCVLYRINNIYVAETLAGADEPKDSIIQIITDWKFALYVYFVRVYHMAIIVLFIKMIKDWANYRQETERLKKEKAQTELNFLKAQLHPHFLFNTLNNIYALALNKADETAESIAKLSHILDYVLYQGNVDKVLIKKEIDLLENYIQLELLRYGERLELDFDYEVDDWDTMISPLILLSIVENAFKHGVSGTIKKPEIRIQLVIRQRELHFQVFNTKPDFIQKDLKNYKAGIGTKNIRRQLELVYPTQHSWEVEEKDDSYQVDLNIAL